MARFRVENHVVGIDHAPRQVDEVADRPHLMAGPARRVTDEVATLQVVVYTENGRSVGLVVDNILDIVEEALAVQRKSEQDGLLGSAVVGGKVTDLLNVQGLVRAFDPTFFEDTASAVLEEVSHV